MNTDFDSRRDWRRSGRNHENGRILTGAFLVFAGAGLFLKNMHLGFPEWLFSWQVLLICLGVYFGLKHHFRGPLWLVLILVGGFSLQPEIFPFINLRVFTWPTILVIMGLFFILRPKKYEPHRIESGFEAIKSPVDEPEQVAAGDKLDIVSILGSVKKVVVSKNFRGGEVVSFLGGSDINLSQADISGRVKLETTNIFGGTKIFVPPSWDIQSELVAVFGGVEDKRDIRSVNIDPSKVLVLEGTCLFGGIEIRSF